MVNVIFDCYDRAGGNDDNADAGPNAGRVTPPLSHFSSAPPKLNSVPDIIHSKLRLSFVVVLNYVFMKLPLIVTVIVGSNIFNSMAAPFSRHKILGNHFCLF